jgi:serine/threonine protein kinase
MDTLIGQQVGNYTVTKFLGNGGFANVYLGRNLHANNMLVAIKILKKEVDKAHADMFLDEARTLADLAHPNIVRIRDCGILEEQIPYLVMDYAPNGTLRQRHHTGSQVPLDMIVLYTRQVAAALQYAHDLGKVHRDVKPANMLLDADSQVLLSDFGLVETTQTAMSLTQSAISDKIGGTPCYMAPEQFRGRIRRASDQYSLAIVVYEWITGDLPFKGTWMALRYQHTKKLPPPFSMKNVNISLAVEEVIMKALSKDSQQRFAKIQIFAEELEKAVQDGQRSHFGISQVKEMKFPDEAQISTKIVKQLPLTNTKPTAQQLHGSNSPRATHINHPDSQMSIGQRQSSQILQHQSILSKRSSQDAIDTPFLDSSSPNEREKSDSWLHFRWFILASAIATSMLFAIGFIFHITTITVLCLIPLAICLILGAFETTHFGQWYWFVGFVVLSPLAGLLYTVVQPDIKPHRPINIKQLIIMLSFLGYALFVVAVIIGVSFTVDQIPSYIIGYTSIAFVLSGWSIRVINHFLLKGFSEEDFMTFFFPLLIPFAALNGLSKLDNQLNELYQE